MMDILGLMRFYPRTSIILLAIVISFGTSLVSYYVLDKEKIREIKAKQKNLQKEMMKYQKEGKHDKVLSLQKEIMSYSMEMIRHSFKPLLITAIPVLFVFALIQSFYSGTVIASSWIWYYIFSTIAGSVVFKKVLNLP